MNIKNDNFIDLYFNTNFECAFILECMNLIKCVFEFDKTINLALELYVKFILPIINDVDKRKHEHDQDCIILNNKCIYLSKDIIKNYFKLEQND